MNFKKISWPCRVRETDKVKTVRCIKRIHKGVEPHSLPVNVSFGVNNTSSLTYSWHHNLSYQWITEPFKEVVRQVVESAFSLENYHWWFKKKCYTTGCDKGARSSPVHSDQIHGWLKFPVFKVKEAQAVLRLNWGNTFKWEQDDLWLPLLFCAMLIWDVLHDLLDALFIACNRLTDGNRQK